MKKDREINRGTKLAEYSRYSKVEIQEYVV